MFLGLLHDTLQFFATAKSGGGGGSGGDAALLAIVAAVVRRAAPALARHAPAGIWTPAFRRRLYLLFATPAGAAGFRESIAADLPTAEYPVQPAQPRAKIPTPAAAPGAENDARLPLVSRGAMSALLCGPPFPLAAGEEAGGDEDAGAAIRWLQRAASAAGSAGKGSAASPQATAESAAQLEAALECIAGNRGGFELLMDGGYSANAVIAAAHLRCAARLRFAAGGDPGGSRNIVDEFAAAEADAERLVLAMHCVGDANSAVRCGAAALLAATHGRWPVANAEADCVPSEVELTTGGGEASPWPESCRLAAAQRLSAALAADPDFDRGGEGRPCRMRVIAALLRRIHRCQREFAGAPDRRRKARFPAVLLRCTGPWLQSVPAPLPAGFQERPPGPGVGLDAARPAVGGEGFWSLVWDLVALTGLFRGGCRGPGCVPDPVLDLWTAVARAQPAGPSAVAAALTAAGSRVSAEGGCEGLAVLRTAAVSAALADPAAAVEAWAAILARDIYAGPSGGRRGGGAAADGHDDLHGEVNGWPEEEELPAELSPADCCGRPAGGGWGSCGNGAAAEASCEDPLAGQAARAGAACKEAAVAADVVKESNVALALLATVVSQYVIHQPSPPHPHSRKQDSMTGSDSATPASPRATDERRRWRSALRRCGPAVLHSAVLAAAAAGSPAARDCGEVLRGPRTPAWTGSTRALSSRVSRTRARADGSGRSGPVLPQCVTSGAYLWRRLAPSGLADVRPSASDRNLGRARRT